MSVTRGTSTTGTNDGSFRRGGTGGSPGAVTARGYGGDLDVSEARKRAEPVRVGNRTWPRSTVEAAGDYQEAMDEAADAARRALGRTDSGVEADRILEARGLSEDFALDQFAARTGLEYPEDVVDQMAAAKSLSAAKVPTSQGRYSELDGTAPLAVPQSVYVNRRMIPFGSLTPGEQATYFRGQAQARETVATGVPMESPGGSRALRDLHMAGAGAALSQQEAAQANSTHTYVVDGKRVEQVTQIGGGVACRGRTMPTDGSTPQDIVFDPRMVTSLNARRPEYQT